MRRLAVVAALAAAIGLVLAAVGVAGAARQSSDAQPTTLTIWVGWSAGTHELKVFKSLVDEYNAKHPASQVKVVGDIDDAKIVAAIRSGTAPDIVSSFNSYNVGNYCGTGALGRPDPVPEEGRDQPQHVPAGDELLHASTAASTARCRCSPTPTASTTTRRSSRRRASRTRRGRSRS